MNASRAVLLVACGGLLAARLPAQQTNETWLVELRDGSRLVGIPLIETLPLQFQGKTVSVKLAMISDWQTSGADAVLIRFRNGDSVTSPPVFESFPLQTSFGDIRLPVTQIVRCVARRDHRLPGLLRRLIAAEHTAGLPPDGIEHDPLRGVTFRFSPRHPFLNFPADDLPVADTPRSVAAWIKTDQRHRRQIIFFWGAKQPHDGCYLIIFEDGRPLARRLAVGNWGGGPAEQAGQSIVNDGHWHHIALTYDGAGNLATYVDGKLDHQMQRNYATSLAPAFTLSSDEPQHAFDGSLADFRIYNRALTPEEIRDLHRLGP